MQKKPLVSIIIPTRNSAEYLDQCLKSILKQSYESIELIVVDNNSTDRTRDIAKRFTKYVYKHGPERSSQRNFGVKKSKGKYIVIIDSDMVLAKNVISACVERIELNKRVVQLIIPEKSVGEGFWAQVKAYERSFYVGDESIEAPRFFLKKVFVKVGGYDERIRGGGEEYDLPDRISQAGFRTGRISNFITHLEGRLTLWETTKTKYYYGKTAFYYLQNHPDTAKKKFTLLRPVFLKKWKILVSHPIYTVSMFIMKSCELGAGALGLLKGIYEKHNK